MIFRAARRILESKSFRRVSPFIIAISAYFAGIRTPEYGKRLIDSLFYRNVPPAKESFKDPAGLTIETRINSNGEKVVYICHKASRRAALIMENLATKTLDDKLAESECLNMPSSITGTYDH